VEHDVASTVDAVLADDAHDAAVDKSIDDEERGEDALAAEDVHPVAQAAEDNTSPALQHDAEGNVAGSNSAGKLLVEELVSVVGCYIALPP